MDAPGYELQEAEMLNARLAMLALLAYTAIEMSDTGMMADL